MAVPLHSQLKQFAATRKQHATLNGNDIAAALRSQGFASLLDVLPSTDGTAVSGDPDDARTPMSHADLRSHIEALNLASHGICPGVRVGVIVSNGPELAVLLVALMATASVVPINSAGSLEEFTSETVNIRVDILITDDEDTQRLAALTLLASELELPLLVLTKDAHHAGAFKLAQAYHLTTTYSGITKQPTASQQLEVITVNMSNSTTHHDNPSKDIAAPAPHTDQYSTPLSPVASTGLLPVGSRHQPLRKLVSMRSFALHDSHSNSDAVCSPAASPKAVESPRTPPGQLTSTQDSAEHGLYAHWCASNKDIARVSHDSRFQGSLGSPEGSLQSQGLRSLRYRMSLRRQQTLSKITDDIEATEPVVSPTVAGFKQGLKGSVVGSRSVRASGWIGSVASGDVVKKYNTLDDDVLILQTSGSTGSKKVVPYTLDSVLVGCCAIAASMELTPSDMAINMMPLFHAGGIFRNVLAPILAGGSTCCMAMFDPCQFWQVADKMGATWYYASPTMHMGILDALKTMDQLPTHRIRLIANAAGPLLPATAQDLKNTFKGAAILPGYGMTECMPISAPPSNYQLEKPASSGLPLGPEVRIGNEQGDELPPHTVGEIMIKGLPLFKAYDGNAEATADAFVQEHFKTGDLGYQDEEGYLFITGRSKDVINRGGEIISPAEVESAAMQVPGINGAAAFPAPHDKLQECVGLVVVCTDDDKRPLLPEIIECLSGILHPSKWPFMVVYMDQLPKGPTGKVMRTGLAKRLDLPELTDRTPMADKHYEATAPPPSAPVTSKIPAQLMPGVGELLQQKGLAGAAAGAEGYVPPRNRLEKACAELIAQVVGMNASEVSADADFFLIGGSSMNASQMAALLRKKFQVSCTGLTVFNYRTPAEMASYLLEQKPDLEDQGWLERPDSSLDGPGSAGLAAQASQKVPEGPKDKVPDPSTNPLVLLIQAIPLLALTPLRRVCGWMLFIYLWFLIANSMLVNHHFNGQIWALIIAIMCSRLARQLVLPWVGLAAKWLIVGRYKAGRYKLWGSMYLRWWIVDKILLLTGPGIFALHPAFTRTYLRLMGAKVGSNVLVSLESTRLREFDLLTLGDGTVIDGRAYMRCFALDNGKMLLAPITLGRDCCICTNGIVPPGTTLPANAGIGHNSCALEGYTSASSLLRLCKITFPAPPLWMQLALGFPIELLAKLVSMAPIVVLLLVVLPRLGNVYHPFTEWQAVVDWLVEPAKILVYLIGAICYTGICPFIYLGMVILIKRLIIGKFTPGPRGGSNWQLFRHWLMGLLLPDETLGGVLHVVGTHWEIISCIYRALGSKVGKHVFWPGSNLLGIVEYDLLTIEDDAVFGSRSVFYLSDAEFCSEIKICAGGNIADRCVMLPGSTIGVNACLGTGGVLGEGQYLEPGAVAVGCQNGTAVVITPGSEAAAAAPTLKPWGKAQYLGQANYWLPPAWMWVAFNWFVMCAEAVFTRSRMVFTWLIVYQLLDFPNNASSVLLAQFFGTMLGVYTIIHIIYSAISFAIVIGGKWLVIGLRQPGEYSWDVSSYCARWNVHICLFVFRGKMMDCLHGTAYIVWYFRAQGCKIGRGVCLYPTGSDPPMNEPELVTIGDNACIDHAFVVNHINTKGQFSLEQIKIGANTTLRAWARLMAGGTMEDGSVMLEHTLALPGETVDTGMAWQGWPVCSVAPVKVLRLQSAQTLTRSLTLKPGLTLSGSKFSASPSLGNSPTAKHEHLTAVALSSPFEGGVSGGLAQMALRKSLRRSNRLEAYQASGLQEHLESVSEVVAEQIAGVMPVNGALEDDSVAVKDLKE